MPSLFLCQCLAHGYYLGQKGVLLTVQPVLQSHTHTAHPFGCGTLPEVFRTISWWQRLSTQAEGLRHNNSRSDHGSLFCLDLSDSYIRLCYTNLFCLNLPLGNVDSQQNKLWGQQKVILNFLTSCKHLITNHTQHTTISSKYLFLTKIFFTTIIVQVSCPNVTPIK